MLYKRELYLRKIRGFYDHPEIIKVITGVRRSGKSSLMQMVIDELKERGVEDRRIIYLNLDRRPYLRVKTSEQLEAVIDPLISRAECGLIYLFIDEIQNVKDFEPLIESLRLEGNISIFITGSNSYLLSSELVTKLTGRYVEVEIMPLNFREYVEMKKLFGKRVEDSLDEEFLTYLREGGFPGAVLLDSHEDRMTYVKNLVREIVRKDVRSRLKIRNSAAFDVVFDFVVGNFGAPLSTGSLHRAFKNRYPAPLKSQTLDRYVKALLDAKVIYECRRFDTKSKAAIGGERKYYLSDLSFYWANSASGSIDFGPALENVIFQLHKGLGHEVSIGKVGNLECDFIVRDGTSSYRYLQVALTIYESEARLSLNKKRTVADREFEPLERIRDNYPKFVLTMDRFTADRNGIKNLNIIDYINRTVEEAER